MPERKPDVVVAGAGIAGLGAALALQDRGFEVVVLEREAEAGGRMRSAQAWDGIWFDRGAEHLTTADAFFYLADRLGFADQVIPWMGDTGGGTSFEIARNGKLHTFDAARPQRLLGYGAIPFGQKLRLVRLLPTLIAQYRRNGGTTFEPWRAAPIDDMSIEEWLNRISPDFLEYAMEPLWDIVAGWEPADISRAFLVYTMTAFAKAQGITLRQGTGAVTRAFASLLDVRTRSEVDRIDIADHRVEYTDLETGSRHTMQPGAVIVALTGDRVAGVVSGLEGPRAEFFAGTRYQAHDLCFFKVPDGTDPEEIGRSGFLPRLEHGELAQYGMEKVPTDPSRWVLRATLKGRFATMLADQPDEVLEAEIMKRVGEVAPHIPPLVEDRFISRWPSAIPMYTVGRLRQLAAYHALDPIPGVAFAGDYLSMPSAGAAYQTGLWAADQVASFLGGA
ncbi:MAG TPA: FAD-dependent oxidoreductase [Acidimicrobiia bacterium]|jgi:oxygen-dependent protoporphyrinogen oxidase|nr:FAD-dependent oxidoreductase [Acidimicrobiia bacterium]